MGKVKRILAMVLAVACLTGLTATSVFADDTASPVIGEETKNTYGSYVVTTKSTVAMESAKSNADKIVKVASSVSKDGNTFKIDEIKANTFKGVKVKKLKVYSKNLTKVSKNAFKGYTKKQLKNLKVVVTKKMSAKNYKKLVKALKAAGVPAKNIRRSTKK